MTRREIEQIFAAMQLEYIPIKNRIKQRWRIPNEPTIVRIAVVLPEENFFSSFKKVEEDRWQIGLRLNNQELLVSPEEGINRIQNIIQRQFESFAGNNIVRSGDWQSYTHSWSSGGVSFPPEPKPIFQKPQSQLFKPQVKNNRLRAFRLGYSGKR